MGFFQRLWERKAVDTLRRTNDDWTAVDWGGKRERGQWILDGMARDLATVCSSRRGWSKAPEGAMESEWDYADEEAAVFIGHGPHESGNPRILAWFCAWSPDIEGVNASGDRSNYITFGRAVEAVEFIEARFRDR